MGRRLDAVGARITSAVGTMWCALAFAALSLVSLPGVLGTGDPVQIVQWVAQTFLQLVLLSVIMVGQRLDGARTENLIRETHDAVLEELGILHAYTAAIHQEIKE